eukprot:11278_6
MLVVWRIHHFLPSPSLRIRSTRSGPHQSHPRLYLCRNRTYVRKPLQIQKHQENQEEEHSENHRLDEAYKSNENSCHS